MFQDWFCFHFVSAVKEDSAKNNLFRGLLVSDNALGHLEDLQDLFAIIKVLFMLPDTTSLIQPLDKAVTVTFKPVA